MLDGQVDEAKLSVRILYAAGGNMGPLQLSTINGSGFQVYMPLKPIPGCYGQLDFLISFFSLRDVEGSMTEGTLIIIALLGRMAFVYVQF